MLDIFNIPEQQDNVKIFYARGTTDWQTWQKPRNCKFIWMMCIGGGAGGGGGPRGAVGAGAGGSGGVVRAIFPANVLPDTLYVQPGLGGGGGAGGNDTNIFNPGGSGGRSFVSIAASSATVINLVCVSGATPAASNSDNQPGAGETIATVANAGLLSLGNFTSTAGQSGGTDVTPLTSTITCGGCRGGSSVSGIPGNILSVDLGIFTTPTLLGGIPGGTVAGNGASGVANWKPLYFLGGAGGGGAAITGGNGGDGSYGCGGGAGGSALSAASGGIIGGNGGKGGDGLVIIATF